MTEVFEDTWYNVVEDFEPAYDEDEYWCQFKICNNKIYFYESHLDGEFCILLEDIPQVINSFEGLIRHYGNEYALDEYIIRDDEVMDMDCVMFDYNLLYFHNNLSREFIEEVLDFLDNDYRIEKYRVVYNKDKVKSMSREELFKLSILTLDRIEREVINEKCSCK